MKSLKNHPKSQNHHMSKKSQDWKDRLQLKKKNVRTWRQGFLNINQQIHPLNKN